MKLSTIIRAIVRHEIARDDEAIYVTFAGDPGPGFGISSVPIRWPSRATVRKVGDLEIAWWGRDTLVHPTEAS